MTHAPNVPRSPRWDQHPPGADDYTADDLRHLNEHLNSYLLAHYKDTDAANLSVSILIDELHVRALAKRDTELDREESMVPPVRVHTLHSEGGHHSRAATNTDIAGWVWYETEYPEHGSVGPWPTRKDAETAAGESDCADWTVAPITQAQLREREMEGEIEAMADADPDAAAAVAAIDTLARSEHERGPDRDVRASAKYAIELSLGKYPIELRREHAATSRDVWALCMAGNYDHAKIRVRRVSLARARAYVIRKTASASGEIDNGG